MQTSRDSLTTALRRWSVNPPADPAFRTAVWQRLGPSARLSWPAYLRSHATAWTAAAAVALAVAVFSGHAAARAHTRAEREKMVVSYLVELDPRVQAAAQP